MSEKRTLRAYPQMCARQLTMLAHLPSRAAPSRRDPRLERLRCAKLQAMATDFDVTAALRALSKADPTLGELFRRWGPFELDPHEARSPYESLFRSVIYQQLHGKAAATILARVKLLYGTNTHDATRDAGGGKLARTSETLIPSDDADRAGRIPKPEELLKTSDEALRAAGLSRAKTLALKDLAAKQIAGIVPTQKEIHELSDQEIIDRLTEIRGIGQWTVEMMLMFQLGRPDVLPATDFGVRSGFAMVYGYKNLPKPKEILEYGERWRPYRSVAAWYMWRAIDLARADAVQRASAEPPTPKKVASKKRTSTELNGAQFSKPASKKSKPTPRKSSKNSKKIPTKLAKKR